MSAGVLGYGGGLVAVKPYWGLTLTAEEAGSTVSMTKNGNAPAVSLETSTDNGRTWTPFVIGETTIVLANVGDSVCFRAGNGGTGGDGLNVSMANSANNYNRFAMSGRIAASGDISSLLDRRGVVRDLTGRDFCFFELFRSCRELKSVSDLKLPATTLALYCYYRMFIYCYGGFSVAPEISAVTLFRGCFRAMFEECTSLTYVKAAFNSWSVADATTSWLSGVAASGTFECPAALGTNETIQRGTSYCPNGWSVINPLTTSH